MELYNNYERRAEECEPALMKTPASWKKYAKSCSAVGAQVLIVREEFMQGMGRMHEISTIFSRITARIIVFSLLRMIPKQGFRGTNVYYSLFVDSIVSVNA